MRRPPSPPPDLVLLLAAVAAPLLSNPLAAAAAWVLVAVWGWRRWDGKGTGIAGAALLAAALALSLEVAWAMRQADAREEWVGAAQRAYGGLWQDLEEEAAHAAAVLAVPPSGDSAELSAFDRLQELAYERGAPPRTLLLLDPDGEAVAWAGPGLLHELRLPSLPTSGITFRSGYTAATLAAVAPLGPGRRPWRVVAGISLPAGELPFPLPGFGAPRAARWALTSAVGPPRSDVLVLTRDTGPRMLVDAVAAARGSVPPAVARARSLAWGVLGLGLFALLARALAAGRHGSQAGLGSALVSAASASAAWSLAVDLPPGLAVLVVAGLTAGVIAVRAPRARRMGLPGPLEGLTVAVLLVAAAWCVTGPGELVTPASGLRAPLAVLLVRLGFFGLALGGVGLVARRGDGRSRAEERWLWLGCACLGAAAAWHDRPLAGAALTAAGLAAAGAWLRRSDLRRPASLAAACLVAALAAGAAWEGAARDRLRAGVGRDLLARMAPPSPGELAVLDQDLRGFFAGISTADLTPGFPSELDPQDLAYLLWRSSPLARPGALSALSVRSLSGVTSVFSFGLPVGAGGEISASPVARDDVALPGWAAASLAGGAPLDLGTEAAELRWRLVLRPGYRLAPPRAGSDLAPELLRGQLPLRRPSGALLGEASYGLYQPDGRAEVSPWRDAPPLPAALRGGDEAVVETPEGSAWAWRREDADGIEVVYLPLLAPAEALERVGQHAFTTLAAGAALGALGLLVSVPLSRFRSGLRRMVRSYSKRLLVVYTLLLLIPLLVINTLLIQVLGDRLVREQRRVGEAALDSAQEVLGEYVLTIEPGFGVATELDDQLLVWLSRVIHHELNLYWGSSVYASSKRELFTAGLLPTRIPGEVYSRIALGGLERSSRINRVGGVEYLEVYAPLKVPGVAQEKLFLSMPLLAQQEEVAAEIASLRSKTLLVTTALFALLLAVAVRLARDFTAPLMELVEGTRRIAAGAPALGLSPNEVELEALVGAIDRMAARIAEGRERVLREKQVVERMMENITAGVVSLDAGGRVLLRNRVAAQLLGAEVGEQLTAALARSGSLRPVAAWLERGGGELRAGTARVAGDDGAERDWSVVWVPLPEGGEPSALLVVEDVTEVLRGQRLQAWAEMARIIAHEIKNPLTPIKLSAEHMRQVYASDPEHFDAVFESCTANILRQVEELRQISSEFSTYSHIPRFEPKSGDLVGSLARVVESYQAAPSAGVSVTFRTERARLEARYDERLLGRAVRNLLENALRAVAGGGAVEVSLSAADSTVRIAVADSGPGVPPDILARIFDPYFSTHAGGTGLGLPIARRIAEEHGGTIAARNREGGGLEVSIALPAGGMPS